MALCVVIDCLCYLHFSSYLTRTRFDFSASIRCRPPDMKVTLDFEMMPLRRYATPQPCPDTDVAPQSSRRASGDDRSQTPPTNPDLRCSKLLLTPSRPKFLLVLLTILVFIACFAPTANAKAGFNVSVGIPPPSNRMEARRRELLKMREWHVTQLKSRVEDLRVSLRLRIEKMESCREILAVNVGESVLRDTKVAQDNLKEFMKCVEDLVPL